MKKPILKKLIIFLWCAVCVMNVFLLSSCTKIVKCNSDELKASSWVGETAGKTAVTLEFFEDNTAQLTISGDADNSCKIGGVCIADESTLLISDKSMARTISIEYRVYGKRLELSYMGGTLILDKAEPSGQQKTPDETNE